MEIKNFVKLASAALVVGSFASCQDYEPFDEATVAASVKAREFTGNFEARYGQIDPNHDWGFEDIEAVPHIGSITRAESNDGVGFVYVNTNQWAVKPQVKNGEEYIEDVVAIPGYPNFDDYYYTNNGGDQEGTVLSSRPSDCATNRPCGDVTDYEIQYVSEFFRSHNKQQLKEYEQKLHLTDFFIQNVSAENDRESYPDGALKNEILGENCNFGMEHLVFKTMDSNDQIDNTWTHMNNYNRNATNLMTSTTIDTDYKTKQTPYYNNDGTQMRQIKYVTSSGTEDFGYQSTWSTNQPYKKEWVLVKLTWMEKGRDGVERQREGYYLAFDYEADKAGKSYGPDGYYSNWIVKITPAFANEIVPESPRRRIMCEDLGNTFDFDFNDVAFDVYFEEFSDHTEAVVSLLAAGGTLPIFVGYEPSETRMEAHKLFEKPSSTPVNVGGASAPVAIYRFNVTYTNPDNIPIYVQQSSNDATNIITLKPATGNGTAIAPQKFCVPVGVRWMKESQQIEKPYQYFDAWVGNKNFKNNGLPWFANSNIDARYADMIFNSGSGINSDYNYNHSHGENSQEPADNITVSLTFNDGGYSGTITIDKAAFLAGHENYTVTFDNGSNSISLGYNGGMNSANLDSNTHSFVVSKDIVSDGLLINVYYSPIGISSSMISVSGN